MGWLITLGVLVLLAILPLGASVRYDEDGPLVKIIAGPVRLTVFPLPKKEKKPKKEKVDKSTPEEPDSQEPPLPEPPKPPKQEKPKQAPEKKKGGSLLDFLPLVRLALDFLGDFRRKLRLNRLEVKLVLAGEDPCDLAQNYGRAWAAIGNLQPQLERLFVIKKRDIDVQCDFTASETLISARLDLTITLGRLLSLLVCYGIRALKEFLSIQKKRKGGAAK